MTSDEKIDNLLSSRKVLFYQLQKDSKLHKVLNTKETKKIIDNTFKSYKTTFKKDIHYNVLVNSYKKAFNFHRKYNTELSMKILNDTKTKLREYINKSK